LFELLRATTPANSELAMGVVYQPMNSLLIVLAEKVMFRITLAEYASEPTAPVK
jgi:hypothetical protein